MSQTAHIDTCICTLTKNSRRQKDCIVALKCITAEREAITSEAVNKEEEEVVALVNFTSRHAKVSN